MQNQELDPSVEVTHLRRLLDVQPACLMRLGADGTVLAANDAALALLGMGSGAQALLQNFSNWVAPDQRERWESFTAAVVQGGAASLECDISAPSGDRHPTLFHAVPLADHPDGVASMAVAARAIAGQRQLETAVVELEERLTRRDADRIEARARLAEAEESRRELAGKVAELEARLHARETDVRQLELALEAKVAELEARLHARETDVRQLELALDAFASRRPQVADERAAAELTARLEERDAALRQLETAHADLAAAHAAARAEQDTLVSSLRELASRLAALADAASRPDGGPQAADGTGSPLTADEETHT
ncbi:MAG: PAS domain-containing protein [Rhodospirillaceae bacterium]